ncbi:MAG: hypothetical protein ABSF28_02120 [Terracidiphilus sp.]|jgi:hypothetical protein
MNRRLLPFAITLFSLLCANAVPALAQAAKHTSPSRPSAADAPARKQLAADLADYQNSPEDASLRDRVVALAKTINPAPQVPEIAREYFAKATEQMESAASPDEFKAAAALFERAAVQAPWYAAADFSAASAFVRAGDFDDARRKLALYRAAVRPGVDTGNAEELERNIAQQQAAQGFQQALKLFSANPNDENRRQILRQSQAMKPPPEIPEEARQHYVMAGVLAKSAEDEAGHGQRAIEEFKAALLIAPWWGNAYRKLAAAEAAEGHYQDAVASLNFYLLTQPIDARTAQDDIYRFLALEQGAADEEAKRDADEQRRKLLEEQRQKERADFEAGKYTFEGRWYAIPLPNNYFVGGELKPECDYSINQKSGRWDITNSCSRHNWAIEDIQLQTGQIRFRLSGHDPGYPFVMVSVTFALSGDGQALVGEETVYSEANISIGTYPVRWVRRR